MMLQIGDDGVVSSVNEEDLIYVDKNELEQLIENYQELEKENKKLKQFKYNVYDLIDKNIKETKELFEENKIDLNSYNSAMIILTGLKGELKGDDGND